MTDHSEPTTAAGRALFEHLWSVHQEGYIGGTTWERIERAIPAIEAEAAASAGSLDVHDLLMKGAEIGYTYGALGRDFAQVLPEVRRLTRQSSEPEEAS